MCKSSRQITTNPDSKSIKARNSFGGVTENPRTNVVTLIGCLPGLCCLLLSLLVPLSATSQKYDPTTLVYPPFGHDLGYHRGGSFLLKLFLGGRLTFDDPQGICCVKLKSLDDPKTTKDDDELTVYGVNAGGNQIVYNKGLTSIAVFDGAENGLRRPRGIAANPEGDVWVVDTWTDRLMKLHHDGSQLRFVKSIGSFGCDKGEFDRPRQVALDSQGNIYVTDTGNNRVQVFDSNGDFIRSFGSDRCRPWLLDHPDGIAVIDDRDRWYYYKDDFLVVADLNGKRLNKFTLRGKKTASVEAKGIGLEDAYFAYIAIDYYGNVWVTDRLNSVIHKFDRNLRFIVSFGRRGTGDKEFISPKGIGLWRRFGQVVILEEEGVQYYWIAVDAHLRGCFPQAFTQRQPGTTVSLYLTEPATVAMKVHDQRGDLVRELLPRFRQYPHENEVVWDGLNRQGEVVEPGRYKIKITLEPTYSSKGHFKKVLEAEVECLADGE